MMRDLRIHMEITSNCNSACLECGRYVGTTDFTNPHVLFGNRGNMSLDTVKNIFDEEISKRVCKVVFTGAFGDAQLHPQLFEILDIIGERTNREVFFEMETNGGLHNPEWWTRFAKSIEKNFNAASRIRFAIDGTDDETHQLYRRGVNWNNVMENANAYMKAGGNAVWQMIEFEHNKHQFPLAEKMSNELGFQFFDKRRSRLRFIEAKKVANPIENKTVSYNPENVKRKNLSEKQISISNNVVNNVAEVQKTFKLDDPKTMDDYYNTCEIECEWKKRNDYSIDYDGTIWQCCYFSMMLHPSFGSVDEAKTADLNEHMRKNMKKENILWYMDKYEQNWNNVNYHTMWEIINHSFFTIDLEKSWNNTMDSEEYPRIKKCSQRCGPASRAIDMKVSGKDFSDVKVEEKYVEQKLSEKNRH